MLGTKVGSYRISKELARGGMGVVYQARHDIMDRDAVVKVLHPRFSHDKEMVSRFFNEARAAASIEHPGIVEIFDVGYAEHQAFIVMERLRGQTLSARLAARPMAATQAVTLVRQITGALGAAHARGIIHRDLKPDNIFIIEDPEVPGGKRVKLLDFGIAKLAEPRDGVMTAQGSLFGTPAYMSPEQCSDAATVDHRADLYAVGCILYQCLTGQPPFGTGGIELLAAHLRDRPVPVRERIATIPDDLDALTSRLLEKSPDDRHQSCKKLIAALDDLDAAALSAVAPEGWAQAASLAPTVESVDPSKTASPHKLATDPTIASNAPNPLATDPTIASPAAGPPDRSAGATALSLEPTLAPQKNLDDEDDQGDALAPTVAPTAGFTEPDIRPHSADDTEPALVESQPTIPGESERSGDTLGGTVGSRPADTPPSRRTWLLGVIALLAVVPLVIWMVMASERDSSSRHVATERPSAVAETPRPPLSSTSPHTDNGDALSRARQAMTARDWTNAIAAAVQVAADSPDRDKAMDLIDQAKRELTNQSYYEQFVAALESDTVQALKLYQRIPENSAYRALAEPDAIKARDDWLARRVRKANKYHRNHRCKKIAKIRADIVKLGQGEPFAAAAQQVAELAATCEQRKQTGTVANEVPDDIPDFDRIKANAHLKSMRGGFAGCVAPSPKGKGRNTLSITAHIRPSGKVMQVGTAHRDLSVRRCINRIGRGITFPRTKQGGLATLTIFY